jgi:putative transposase
MPLKAIRLRVYPTHEQKQLLNQWFGVCRWTYNQCAHAINEKRIRLNKKELRAAFLNNTNFETVNTWVKDVPYDIRDEAMNDALKAVKAHKAKKKENQTTFNLKYRSRRDPTQSVVVLEKHWNHHKTGVYSPIFAPDKLKCHEKGYSPLPAKLPHDSRLLRDKNKRYFLCMPIALSLKDTSAQLQAGRVVAIDPGVRTFLTTYDQDGEVSEWGKGDQTRLYRLAVHVDKLNANAALTRHSARYRIKKAIGRVYDKIRNLVDDVHKKACKWLCERYSTILIPAFNASEMTKRDGRRIHTKTVRNMLAWSHYRFRQRLLFKATEYPGVQVKVGTEEYTSKTCGNCGVIHQKLGGNKRFKCPSCGWVCDRDVNGARNIMLKALTEELALDASSSPLPSPPPIITTDLPASAGSAWVLGQQ